MEVDNRINLMNFSDCLLLDLLSYVDSECLYNLSRVNKRLQNLILDTHLWYNIIAKRNAFTKKQEEFEYYIDRINEKTGTFCVKFNSPTCTLPNPDYDLLMTGFSISKNLTVVALEKYFLHGAKHKMKHFPKTIQELSFRGTEFIESESFFKKSFEEMENLRVLILDECKNIKSSVFMSVSKYKNLEIFSCYKCQNIDSSIPYFSIAGWHGFKKLKILDVQLSGLGNSLIKSFYKSKSLLAMYFRESDTSFQLDFSLNVAKKLKNGTLTMDALFFNSPSKDFVQLNEWYHPYDVFATTEKLSDLGTLDFRHTESEVNHVPEWPKSILYKYPYSECTCGKDEKVVEKCYDFEEEILISNLENLIESLKKSIDVPKLRKPINIRENFVKDYLASVRIFQERKSRGKLPLSMNDSNQPKQLMRKRRGFKKSNREEPFFKASRMGSSSSFDNSRIVGDNSDLSDNLEEKIIKKEGDDTKNAFNGFKNDKNDSNKRKRSTDSDSDCDNTKNTKDGATSSKSIEKIKSDTVRNDSTSSSDDSTDNTTKNRTKKRKHKKDDNKTKKNDKKPKLDDKIHKNKDSNQDSSNSDPDSDDSQRKRIKVEQQCEKIRKEDPEVDLDNFMVNYYHFDKLRHSKSKLLAFDRMKERDRANMLRINPNQSENMAENSASNQIKEAEDRKSQIENQNRLKTQEESDLNESTNKNTKEITSHNKVLTETAKSIDAKAKEITARFKQIRANVRQIEESNRQNVEDIRNAEADLNIIDSVRNFAVNLSNVFVNFAEEVMKNEKQHNQEDAESSQNNDKNQDNNEEGSKAGCSKSFKERGGKITEKANTQCEERYSTKLDVDNARTSTGYERINRDNQETDKGNEKSGTARKRTDRGNKKEGTYNEREDSNTRRGDKYNEKADTHDKTDSARERTDRGNKIEDEYDEREDNDSKRGDNDYKIADSHDEAKGIDNAKGNHENQITDTDNTKFDQIYAKTEKENAKTDNENAKRDKENAKIDEDKAKNLDNVKTDKENQKTDQDIAKTNRDNEKINLDNAKRENDNKKSDTDYKQTEKNNANTDTSETKSDNVKNDADYKITDQDIAKNDKDIEKTHSDIAKINKDNERTNIDNQETETSKAKTDKSKANSDNLKTDKAESITDNAKINTDNEKPDKDIPKTDKVNKKTNLDNAKRIKDDERTYGENKQTENNNAKTDNSETKSDNVKTDKDNIQTDMAKTDKYIEKTNSDMTKRNNDDKRIDTTTETNYAKTDKDHAETYKDNAKRNNDNEKTDTNYKQTEINNAKTDKIETNSDNANTENLETNSDNPKTKTDNTKTNTENKESNESSSKNKQNLNQTSDSDSSDNSPSPKRKKRSNPLKVKSESSSSDSSPSSPNWGLLNKINNLRHSIENDLDRLERIRECERRARDLRGNIIVVNLNRNVQNIARNLQDQLRPFALRDQRDQDNMRHIQIFENVHIIQVNNNVRAQEIPLKHLSLRGSIHVTDKTLLYLAKLNLNILDLTYTSVTKKGIDDFLSRNKTCRVIHESFCTCLPAKN